MRCPAQSKHKDKGAGYESLSNALSEFEDSHSMPMNIPEFLTKDAQLRQTLMSNCAKFHKSCLNKLMRANCKGKRPYDAVEEPVYTSPAKTRKHSLCTTVDGGNVCVF